MEPTPRSASAPGTPASEDRSLGRLVRSLADESATLVRQEFGLAKAELSQNMKALARDVARLSLGGAVAAVGGLVLVAFLVALLGDLLGDEYWLSSLIVGVLLAAVGAWMALRALKEMRRVKVAPEETIASLRMTQSWAREEAEEFRTVFTGDGARPTAAPRPRSAALPPPRTGSHPAEPASREEGANGSSDEGLLKRVWNEIGEDDVSGQAAKVAYYAFLALPPAILVLFGLTGFFGGNRAADWITRQLETALPPAASTLIDDFVQQIVHQNAPGPFSIGLLLALWAASNVFMALGDSLNTAYDVEEQRSWVKRRLIAVGVMLGGVILMLAGSVLILAGPQIAGALSLFGTAELIWNIVQWPLAFLFVAAAFWIVYYVLPDRDQSEFKKLLFKAALAAALLWVVATAAFRFYVTNFGSYSETYGILGAVIVLLLWLYVTGMVILAGGELASEMEEKS